jgi:hypothetical protein
MKTSKDQMLGAGILAVCALLAIGFVGLLFFYDPYIASFLNIGVAADVRFWLIAAPVAVALVAIMTIGAWIGWTMASTPSPKPIEKIEAENEKIPA